MGEFSEGGVLRLNKKASVFPLLSPLNALAGVTKKYNQITVNPESYGQELRGIASRPANYGMKYTPGVSPVVPGWACRSSPPPLPPPSLPAQYVYKSIPISEEDNGKFIELS